MLDDVPHRHAVERAGFEDCTLEPAGLDLEAIAFAGDLRGITRYLDSGHLPAGEPRAIEEEARRTANVQQLPRRPAELRELIPVPLGECRVPTNQLRVFSESPVVPRLEGVERLEPLVSRGIRLVHEPAARAPDQGERAVLVDEVP